MAGERLPAFDYEVTEHEGQLQMRFSGLWTEVTMWEVYALALVSEMRTRCGAGAVERDGAGCSVCAGEDEACGRRSSGCGMLPEVRISEFGTRRRHSFLWQEYVIEAMRAAAGARASSGTSNTFLAYKHDLEAMGTNAHELPMALAALAREGR